MSIQDIVNSPDWEEMENVIQKKIIELLEDIPAQTDMQIDMQTIAVHALANRKAYTMLRQWLNDAGFFRGTKEMKIKRDYK